MRTILVIDDEPRITEAFQELFRYEPDYAITCANDGERALDLIREKQPDLIVLDWRLKGEVEGKEVLLYSKATFPKTPVYIVTASIQALKEIESLGADACFLKPCEDLKDKIKRAFGKKE